MELTLGLTYAALKLDGYLDRVPDISTWHGLERVPRMHGYTICID